MIICSCSQYLCEMKQRKHKSLVKQFTIIGELWAVQRTAHNWQSLKAIDKFILMWLMSKPVFSKLVFSKPVLTNLFQAQLNSILLTFVPKYLSSFDMIFFSLNRMLLKFWNCSKKLQISSSLSQYIKLPTRNNFN